MDDIISAQTFLLVTSSISVRVVVDMSVKSVTCEDMEDFEVCFSLSLRLFFVACLGVMYVVKSYEISIGIFCDDAGGPVIVSLYSFSSPFSMSACEIKY